MVSFSISNRLPDSTSAILVIPVTFPAGRARLSTSPSVTGSPAPKKTIGTVLVAFLAARAAGLEVVESGRLFDGPVRPQAREADRVYYQHIDTRT